MNFEIQESIIDAPPKISNPFDRLINSPQFSDVTFRVIDEYECEKLFYVHKGILACSSPVFTAMLTNGMKETYEREIRLCQINHDAFASLLRFIYTFEINIQSMTDAEQLLALAERFEVVPVRDECLRYLRLELNLDNVWGVWELAGVFITVKPYETDGVILDTVLIKFMCYKRREVFVSKDINRVS